VNDLTDASVINTLRQQMTFAAGRQVVAASNLANVDTPGYKAKEFDFSDTLSRMLQGGPRLATTSTGHITSPDDMTSATTKDAEGLAARRDGNTVQIDREMLKLTDAAGDFSKAQTALAAKFRLVKYAINEGR
jgi:flagellar basal-body rod protein FlgB